MKSIQEVPNIRFKSDAVRICRKACGQGTNSVTLTKIEDLHHLNAGSLYQ